MKDSCDEGSSVPHRPPSHAAVTQGHRRSVGRSTYGLSIESRKIQNPRADAFSCARKATPHPVVKARTGSDVAGPQTSCMYGNILRGARRSSRRQDLRTGSREIHGLATPVRVVRTVNPK